MGHAHPSTADERIQWVAMMLAHQGECGVHKGQSPLQLSGMVEAPTDWLVALGYGPSSESSGTSPQPPSEEAPLAA
jgi:hypothetical protein